MKSRDEIAAAATKGLALILMLAPLVVLLARPVWYVSAPAYQQLFVLVSVSMGALLWYAASPGPTNRLKFMLHIPLVLLTLLGAAYWYFSGVSNGA
jgi:hypothetical protein